MQTNAPNPSAVCPGDRRLDGERFEADARLIISPRAGVFRPVPELADGAAVAAGQIVGHVEAGADRVAVHSPFAGRAEATLAWAGERLQVHQPVMWLSVAAPRR